MRHSLILNVNYLLHTHFQSHSGFSFRTTDKTPITNWAPATAVDVNDIIFVTQSCTLYHVCYVCKGNLHSCIWILTQKSLPSALLQRYLVWVHISQPMHTYIESCFRNVISCAQFPRRMSFITVSITSTSTTARADTRSHKWWEQHDHYIFRVCVWVKMYCIYTRGIIPSICGGRECTILSGYSYTCMYYSQVIGVKYL